MSMRITNNMVSDRVISDLQSQYAQLANTQLQVSTGRRVNNPSEDPTAYSQERMQNSALAGIQASQTSVNSAQTWLNQSESSLDSINSIIARAKDLATAAANGSMSQDGRNSTANEIDQLIKSVKDAMNTKVGNDYIFSGTRTDTAPYTDATGDAYQGDANAVVRSGGTGVTLQANPTFVDASGASTPLTAGALLGGGSASGDGKILNVLTQLAAHLRGGTTADIAAIGTTDLTALETNRVAVVSATQAIGAMGNRATAATSRLQDMEDNAKNSIDDLTGVDMAQALTDYSTQSAAYQAALKVGAQIIQPSLLQFLS
ncbi:flagellar hook-associated protein FlgL [Conexibacter woesei]|uniref:flagellar hook-associated protein FlgL n=1 Tax=Conexibacter woesei TaxID=191495 RepID=UPI0004144852|nr:flagellar hook-associated protein FlgL [Conexibacter woesei]